MTSPTAATTSRSRESPSPVPSSPAPVLESQAVMSVVPPAYMSSSETLSTGLPNYSSIAVDQSSYCDALSTAISDIPSGETLSTPLATLDTASSPDAGSTEAIPAEAAATEAMDSESSASESSSETTEEASAEENATAEDAASTEATEEETLTSEEEPVSEEENAETSEADEDAGSEDTAASAGAGQQQEEDEGIEALVTKLPRMSPIRTPFVASPPPQAIQRRDEIIKRTGSPPEQHHAQIRQTTEQVAQAARDAQRRMVWQIGNLAKDTRISIEDMADEVLKVTAQAVAQINQAINRSIADLGIAAMERNEYLDGCTLLTGEALEANRNATNEQVAADLIAGSAAITELNTVAEGRFNAKKSEAETKILAVPTQGAVGRLTPPSSSAASGGEPPPPLPQPGDRTSDYQIMPHARENLVSFIDTKSRVVGVEGEQSANYYRLRATPVLDGMEARTQTQLVQSAQEKAENISSEATHGQFMIMLLGLTTPISSHHEWDESGTVDENEQQILAQMTEVEAAHYQANKTITQKAELASEYLDQDLRETLTSNIWKAGHKAAKGLRKQAAAAEVALNNSAVPMAEAYRDLVDKLNALLPPGQFLDTRQIVPKLIAARNNAQVLQIQHVAMGKEQSLATIAQMEEVKKQQADGLLKSAASSIDSVHDVVTRTSFDMELFVMQITGASHAGAGACMEAAQTYASSTAEQINNSIHGTEGPGLDRIDSAAVGFLNSNINSAEQSQFRQLAGYVESMGQNTIDGPLIAPMQQAKGDLNTRSTALDNAMPGRSTGTAVGLGLISPIALGVYLYSTDADEDVVIEQLGNLMWPGVLALEEVFEVQQHHGSLRGRIRDELSDPEESNALNLFSTNPDTRADARLDIANNSTGWFDYNRAARESALQGMSSEERGTLSESQITATRDLLTDGLNEHQAEVATAYLDGNRERAVAARTREALDKGRAQGQWGWIFSAQEAQNRSDQARVDAIANMDNLLRQELAVENAFARVKTTEELRGSSLEVYQEFASLTDPRRRRADEIGVDEAENMLINYASQGHAAAVLDFNPLGLVGVGPVLSAHPEMINMSNEARNFIAASVRSGNESNEARSARGVYEISRARQDTFGPSETSQTRLSDALENRELARLEREANNPASTPQARSRAARLLEAERANHRRRLQDMARGLNAPEDVANDPVRAEAWMRSQVGDLFANTRTLGDRLGITNNPSHRRYGEEMITSGRASLDATVALATEGFGTHEDLLRRGYADRTHAEIDAANARWHAERGGSMEAMLGLHAGRGEHEAPGGGWWSNVGNETSGDLAMELEVLAHGNPENDLDRIAIANLRYDQQRVRGTGFIAEYSMRGTDEQRFLDGTRDDMARTIIAEAVRRNPELAGRFDDNPSAIFNADGSINSEVSAAAFENGKFRGDVTLLQSRSENIDYAATAYRAEIDRQEAMLTTGITVLALIATIAIMCIPGVNVVAAGIITAVLAGAATIAVKYGMRGERYGWEEAATDVATTAIEVATAGIGGGLAGGLGKTGRLARIGETMIARMGRIPAAIAREAIVSAVSSAASTAIQDDTWKDGFGAGLGRVANGAIRGAVVSGISAGLSEGLTAKLNTRMNVSDVSPERMNNWQKMATRLGPHGSEMFREGITNGFGTLIGEAVGVGIDYAQGNFHGDFGEALKRIGMSTLRDTITSAARGGVTSMNRQRYRELLDVARSGGPVSDSQLKALHLFAISAGALNYDSNLGHIRQEVESARNLLARLPPGLREHARMLDVASLSHLVDMVLRADMGDLAEPRNANDPESKRDKFLRELAESVPSLDTRALMHELELAIARRNPTDADSGMDITQQQQLRGQLGAHLHERLKFALDDVRLEGLQHLSEAELERVARMIASGNFDSAHADSLMRAAKARNPDLDEFAFLSHMQAAVIHSGRVQSALLEGAKVQRREVLALLPEEAATVFAQMRDVDITLAQKLIRSGNAATPQELDSLFHAAQSANPELSRDQFHGFMATATAKVRQQMATESQARRTVREERMTHVPEELRSTLSALPESGLIELRLRQMEGSLSPAEKNRLLTMAQRETPNADLRILAEALEQAVKQPPREIATEAQTSDMLRHLLSAIPADQRSLVEHTRIMVVPADEFAAFTRSKKGQAVTLIINGEPVVVVREGANPRVLREEGIHALQAKDPRWAKHIGALDERSMAQWDSLPLEQQIVLYRNKVALELDAQSRLIHAIESDIEKASSRTERRELEQHLAQVKGAFENLSRRNTEVGGLDTLDIANIKAGFSERPQWLDQPARLFNKTDEEPIHTVKTEQEVRDELNAHIAGGARIPKDQLEITRQLTVVELRQLVSHANNDPNVVRSLLSRAGKSGNVAEFTQQFIRVMDGFSADQRASALRVWPDMKTVTLRDLLSNLHNLRSQHSDDNNFQALVRASTHDGRLVAEDVRELARISKAFAEAETPIKIADLVAHFTTPDDLYTALTKLGSFDDPAVMARHLLTVIDALSPEQSVSVKAALLRLTPDVFSTVVGGFSQLAQEKLLPSTFHALVDVVMDAKINKAQMIENLVGLINRLDTKGLQAMASLLDQTDVGTRGEFLDALVIFSNITLRPLEQSLLGHDSGKLFNLLIETAATQRNWIVFMENAGELLTTMHNLPRTDANQEAIAKVLKYLFDARGDLSIARPLAANDPTDAEARFKPIRQNNDLLQLAADINAAANDLRNSPDREKTFNDQAKRQTTEGRLAGSDAWQTYLQNEAMHWTAFKNNPDTKNFADLLMAATSGWSDGELAAVRDMHVWFEHLAASRGIDPANTAARAKLLNEILDRGFGVNGRRSLSSEGKMTSLTRAFRELAVEAHTGIRLDPKAPRDPVRMQEALQRLGLTEQQLALRSDAEVIRKHIYDLVSREAYYEAMQMIADSKGIGDTTYGIKQNITEVIGEIALTQHMLTNEPNFRLETPFGKGTGFDQVWARRDTAGRVLEFVVGEAKGPGAQLGTPGKGAQMSAEWVLNTVKEMMASTDPGTHDLGVEMMDAIKESRRNNRPIIRGVVIEAGNPPSSGSHNRSSPITGQTGYDFSKFNLPLSGS